MSKGNILISNIYYMLTYAFQVLNQSNYTEMAAEPFDNIHNLFAAILEKGIAQQLKQGLHREYIEKKENLSVMHGKIDINDTMKNRMQNKRVLSCEFDELSVNNIYNQVLKTTVILLLHEDSVKIDTKLALKKELLYFAEVEEIDPFLIKWDAIRFHRNNQSYRMLLTICQFVLEGLLLTTEEGSIKLAQFIDEQRMCRLYEKFILEFYNKEMPMLTAKASQIDWQLDTGDSTMLPKMQSDIMLTYGGKTLIIDAKYYSRSTQEQFGKHTLHSQNVYQIFTYVKNEDVGNTGNVAGLLLYAKTDEPITPDVDVVISKSKISAKTFDLNRNFSELSDQLKKIAKDYFEI